MDEQKTDNELMMEFAGCSKVAYNNVYERYKDRLYNYILRLYIKDRDKSMDVVQDTFIRVYEYKYLYKTKYEFSTWIYTIARNFALNELRRKKHSNYQEDIEDPIRHEDHLHTQETVSLILDYLSPKYREVIVLRYLQGMSFEEISKITGKNINTLKSLAKRGLDGGREMCERNGVEL